MSRLSNFTAAVIDEIVIALHRILKLLDAHRFPGHLGVCLEALHFLSETTVQ